MMPGETPSGAAKALAERLAMLTPARRDLLERMLARAGTQAIADDVVPARARPEAAPLSFSQEHLWQIQHSSPGLSAYNVPQAIRIAGPLDAAALHAALDELVARYPLLRTSVNVSNGVAVTVVREARALPLDCIDLRAHAPEVRERMLASEVRRVAAAPFDLEADLLLRAALFMLGAADHVLLLVWHHFASDETSADILFRDLGALYDARVADRPPDLPPLRRDFADFATWQRAHWTGSRLDELARAWSGELDTDPARLELPLDRARPLLPSYDGARRTYRFEGPWVLALIACGTRHGATPFVTLLAAFAALLHRYSQQERFSLGSVFSTRGRREFENVFGYFSGVLPFGIDCSGDPAFAELLARVRETYLFVMDHRDVPFHALSAEITARDLHPALPALDVFFAMTADHVPSFEGLDVSPVRVDLGTVKLDLFAGAAVDGERLRFDVEFRTELFDAATIDRMFENFGTLMQAIARDPQRRVSEFAILGAADRALLRERNCTESGDRAAATVVDLFREQTARTPDAVAVACAGDELSYAQLDDRVSRVATLLRARGVRAGVAVAILVERSADMIAAVLAVQRAGGAYVPIDETYPANRIAFVLEDARPALTIVHESLRSLLPDGSAVLSLDGEARAIAACDPSAATWSPGPTDIAHVIYTSGSTGRPKGALIEHRNVSNFVASTRAIITVEPGDTIVASASLAFDMACFEIYVGLSSGARVEVVPRATVADAAALVALLARARATLMMATPSLWQMLVESGWNGLDTLVILCGGEALPPALAERLLSCGRAAYNVYGPTETTVLSTFCRMRLGEPVTLGTSFANVKTYVLDRAGRALPSGAPGELAIGGAGVGRGYLNRPELSAERFVNDPFAQTESTMYRTGDRVRWTNTGRLEYLGRFDDQVKIRGYRIELGEIEHALTSAPEVSSAAVVVRFRAGEPELVAYYIARDRGTAAAELETTLRTRLREALPPYMMPSVFVALGAWPVTVSGKLDRAALARRDDRGLTRHVAFVALRTGTEERLADIWKGVLHRESLGALDNFFDLGGQSILAMRIVSRVYETFGLRLPLATLFERPTIASMAAFVDEAGTAAAPGPVLTRGVRATMRLP